MADRGRELVITAQSHVVAGVAADQMAGRQARFKEQHLAQFNLGLSEFIAINHRWVFGNGLEHAVGPLHQVVRHGGACCHAQAQGECFCQWMLDHVAFSFENNLVSIWFQRNRVAARFIAKTRELVLSLTFIKFDSGLQFLDLSAAFRRAEKPCSPVFI